MVIEVKEDRKMSKRKTFSPGPSHYRLGPYRFHRCTVVKKVVVGIVY